MQFHLQPLETGMWLCSCWSKYHTHLVPWAHRECLSHNIQHPKYKMHATTSNTNIFIIVIMLSPIHDWVYQSAVVNMDQNVAELSWALRNCLTPFRAPSVTDSWWNTVLRSLALRKSKSAQYFHYALGITELPDPVVVGPWSHVAQSCYSVIGDKPFLWSKAKFDPP